MKDIIFLTEPRIFKNVDNTEYTVVGISGKIHNSYEVIIGSNLPVKFELKFWENKDLEYIEREVIEGALNKEYNIPNIGIVPILSGFFSTDKETIYNMAKIVCAYYGYDLKPLTDQIFLNGAD